MSKKMFMLADKQRRSANTRTAILSSIILLSSASIASAATICFPDGMCFYSEQTCAGNFIPGDGAVCTEDALRRPATDYLVYSSGRAWLVSADKKTPFASDAMIDFFKAERAKFPEAKWHDPVVKKQITADIQAFRRKDNGLVSQGRLQRYSQQTKLRVTNGDK